MFSRRTRWDRTENPIARALAERRRRGEPLLDLTESNPTRVGLTAPADALAELARPEARAYDPAPRGLPAAREAVARDYARRGLEVGAERVVLTASSSEAYGYLFKLLCEPGDDVLVPRPSYPLFDYLAGLESVELRPYTLAHDDQWHVAPSALEAALGPRTRAVVVVSPNNPTGSFLKRDEAEALVELCAARGLAIVADEVFADYAFGPDARRAPSFAVETPALAFALGGLSKSCGLPQLKLGWITVSGPARLAEEALERLEIVADTYLSVATPVQLATPELLARLPELQAPIAARVAANRRRLLDATRGSAATPLGAEGGWYEALKLPATRDENERVLRLLERGVLVHPGYFFDFPGGAHLVLSLLPREVDFAAGLDRVLEDLVL